MFNLITFLLALSLTLNLFAQGNDIEKEIQLEAAKELERINNEKGKLVANPEEIQKQNCSNCTDGQSDENNPSKALMSPQKALEEITSEPLKYIGRDLLPINDQNRSCLFENSKVVVIYNNCRSDKKEVRAQDINIISKNGGMIRFYNEIFGSNKAHSSIPRAEYDGTWTIEWTPTPKIEKATMKNIIDLLKENKNQTLSESCYIGSSFKAKERTAQAYCPSSKKYNYDEFKKSSEVFWSEPPQLWYDFQKNIRKLVVETKY